MNVDNYSILSQINSGAFGTLYSGQNKRTGEKVAIKVERTGIGLVKHEAKMLQYLYQNGVRYIPPIYWYGIWNSDIGQGRPTLIIPQYSCNLLQYIQNRQLTQDNIKIIMCKMLRIFEQIHVSYIVHRDIKPQNFMVSPDLILIDFGLATWYIDDKGEHIKDIESSSMIGTPRFASIRVHQGHRYSRRDDLISLGYLYVWMLFGGKSPWEPTKEDIMLAASQNQTKMFERIDIRHECNMALLKNKQLHIFQKKCLLAPNDPSILYLNYTYSLDFDTVPDYEQMQSFFMPK